MMVASGEKRKEMFLLEIGKNFVPQNLGPLAPRWFDKTKKKKNEGTYASTPWPSQASTLQSALLTLTVPFLPN